jgi:hypothetical protein
MNFCHNCNHCRLLTANPRPVHCAKGKTLIWQPAKGSMDLDYGWRSDKRPGCGRAFEERAPDWYDRHFRKTSWSRRKKAAGVAKAKQGKQ